MLFALFLGWVRFRWRSVGRWCAGPAVDTAPCLCREWLDVTTRQSLPIVGVVLVALAAAIWAYVSGPREDNARQTNLRAGDVRRSPAGTQPRHSASAAPGQRRRLRRQWRIRRQQLAQTADIVDAVGVRLRSNLSAAPLVQLSAGWYALQSDRPKSALRHFDHLLGRQPANSSAWAGKALALLALQRHEEAAEAYSQLVAAAPQDIRAHYNLGVLLARLARFGEAAVQFREVLCRDPKHAQALYNLARLAQRDGRLAEARLAWEDYTLLRPNDASAWFALGVLYLDSRRPFEAARCFGAVVNINPDDSGGYQNLAAADSLAGHPEAALEALTAANALLPCDPTIMRRLVDLHRSIAAWAPLDADAHLSAAVQLEEEIGEVNSAPMAQALAGGSDMDAEAE